MKELKNLVIEIFEKIEEQEFEGKKWRFMGTMGSNREEYTITELATFYMDGTVAPLYETLGLQAIEYILKQT